LRELKAADSRELDTVRHRSLKAVASPAFVAAGSRSNNEKQ
jgi:hypothetical protein